MLRQRPPLLHLCLRRAARFELFHLRGGAIFWTSSLVIMSLLRNLPCLILGMSRGPDEAHFLNSVSNSLSFWFVVAIFHVL